MHYQLGSKEPIDFRLPHSYGLAIRNNTLFIFSKNSNKVIFATFFILLKYPRASTFKSTIELYTTNNVLNI